MDKAFCGEQMRCDYSRCGVYREEGERLIASFENIGSVDVTRRRLTLTSRDSTTGWYNTLFIEEDAEGVLIPRSSARLASQAGTWVRSEYLFITLDPFEEGDEITDENQTVYQVKAVRPQQIGDSFSHYECDLVLLPFKHLVGRTYTESSVDDARYRTKDVLEGITNPDTALNSDSLPNFIVAFGMPNYPIVKVFKTKNVDLAFSILEPTSTANLNADLSPYGYTEHVPIETYCIDKSNIVGTKLKWQAESELRRILEDYPTGSQRSLERRGDNDQNLGSTILYSARFIWRYDRDLT